VICFILHPSSLSRVSAGTLRTADGRTIEGDVRLEPDGQISVAPTRMGAGKPEKFDLSQVLQATFRNDPAPGAKTAPKAAPALDADVRKIPAPWQVTDVGDLAEKGYARHAEGVFSLKTAGANVAGRRDALCLVHQPAGAEAELTARVRDVADPRAVAAGVMIRASAEPDAPYAGLFCVNNDVRFMFRGEAGEATEGARVGVARTLPLYLRLTRRDDAVTAYVSRDGVEWEQVARERLPALRDAAPALAGLAVCGREERLLGAHLDKVRLTPSAPAAARPAAAASAPAVGDGAAAAATVAARPLKPGVMLRSGTLLANTEVGRADEGTLRFDRDGRPQTVSLASVARVVFRELSPEQAAKIPDKATGVLLKEGDFVEGEFKGVDKQGRIQLSSVLFGLARFEPKEKAIALVINDVDPAAKPELTLRTADGSVYAARSVKFENDKLTIDDALAGQFTVSRGDVTELTSGGGRTESLAALKPAKVEPEPKPGAPAPLAVDSTGVGLPMTIAGVTAARGLTLPAGASASWDVAGAYRTLTFKCGVPAGVLATAPVRFVVLADGKEVYRSKPRTSLDQPLTASVPLKDVKTLTLKTESTSPDPLPTPGLWQDPSLVK
jgi:hypothetical protein